MIIASTLVYIFLTFVAAWVYVGYGEVMMKISGNSARSKAMVARGIIFWPLGFLVLIGYVFYLIHRILVICPDETEADCMDNKTVREDTCLRY